MTSRLLGFYGGLTLELYLMHGFFVNLLYQPFYDKGAGILTIGSPGLHTSGPGVRDVMSPIFPGITDWRQIVEATRDVVDEYWFENLNLRGGNKADVMSCVHETHPELDELYWQIFTKGDESYWLEMKADFTQYCEERGIRFTNAFHHSRLVAAKKVGAPLVRRDF